MADFADDGQALSELALQHALEAQRRASATRKLPPKGVCYNCEEPLEKINGEDVKLFCDSDCAEDFEKRTKTPGQR